MVPAKDAAELTLKMFRRWSEEAKNQKAVGEVNIRFMKKSQTLWVNLD